VSVGSGYESSGIDRFDLEIVVRAEGSTLAELELATPALARGTIEEKTRKLQQAKAELARSIVQEENLASVMSLDDLRFVLSEDTAE